MTGFRHRSGQAEIVLEGVSVQGPSFHIETFGCQMNEQDSLRISQQLLSSGYRRARLPDEADILIVNTCSIRRKAEEKVYSLLGRYRLWRASGAGRTLAVGGCVAQQKGDRLLKRVPYVDIVFGPQHVSRIAEYVRRCREEGERLVAVSLEAGSLADLECAGIPDQNGLRAFMTIMEGCDNFCSYCIVPYVRGRERSRPVGSLVEEVHRLVGQGVRDITLLGQNVNAYLAPDRPDFRFFRLLRELGAVSGLRRLRFTTSHPRDLSPDLIRCFGELDTLCEHIHLPLQSGSDGILEGMNRGYSIGEYERRVDALRKQCPDMAITSDLIVGFPGETDKDFEETMNAVRRIEFDNVFSFKYSPRPETRAASLPCPVPEEEKVERLRALQGLQAGTTLRKNRALEGRVVEVLVEGNSRDGQRLMGRTRTNKVVNFPSDREIPGPFFDVFVEKGCRNSLVGSLASRKGNTACSSK